MYGVGLDLNVQNVEERDEIWIVHLVKNQKPGVDGNRSTQG